MDFKLDELLAVSFMLKSEHYYKESIKQSDNTKKRSKQSKMNEIIITIKSKVIGSTAQKKINYQKYI
jgi:hypothetical protein